MEQKEVGGPIETSGQLALRYVAMLVDVARESFLILGPDLRVISANPKFYEVFRTSPEQTEHRLLYELGGGQWNIPELKTLLVNILVEKKVMKNYEVTHAFPTIGKKTMILNGGQIAAAQLIILAIEDVTDTKDLEKFKLALDNTSDHVVITDPEGVVIYGNRAVEKNTGYKLEEVLGTKAGVLWKAPMPAAYYQNFWDTIRVRKETFVGEIQNKRKGGEIYTAVISVSPVLDANQNVLYFVGIERDITKEKEVDKAKTEFISLASHQLKTPATAISWLSERMLQDRVGTLNPQQTEYMKSIRTTDLRMIDLVDTLLNISRIELGAFSVQPAQRDVCDVVRKALRELRPLLDQGSLVLEEAYPEGGLPLLVDEQLFLIVINNLATNAVRYTAPGGTVRVTCFRAQRGQEVGGQTLSDDRVIVSVADTGCGIPERQQHNLFTKFFRSENAKRLRPDGTGLGLYMAKSILDRSSGSIWFVSEENKGSTFYVAIPPEGMRERSGNVVISSPRERASN